ncbi:DUF1735 domain-containing protein [Mucilaginibacter sp. ZT4R22]|uniref:DUF1735 domain-containing protein n=1 Tax=Mucilaginibacter pankratovii TaxID=2772110 RepID=A0ABR7WMV8_9SPHI|nr:DUF1735 domain-containing protein [Mucilaginibacter pankratovii]MBD1363644.1 DUF1735 domain-containing protein [Mucilaginibacter pankratovii]
MKKISYLKNISMLLGLAAVVSFSSCLKDKNFVDFAAVGVTVELPLAPSGIQAQSFEISSTPATFQIAVNVASPKPLSTPLDVTIAVDQAALTAYNTANSTSYELLPAAAYTLSGTKLTVPANQRLVYLTVTVKSSVIDPSKAYVLPISLVDASGQTINANYHTLLTIVGVKNKYDGVYKATGKFVRVGLDERTINQNKSLSTVNGNTVQSSVADLGSPLNLTVNADNSVTVTFAGSSLTTLPAEYTQDGVNTYDPTTKTFTLHYQYRSGARTTEEKLVYVGPR